ncbi:hypothetical protein SAMN05444920_103736 [Nonomuraea solani]|uniref:Uncharacterized protein n=1 Tax=Nonomuraea solani TaxID=1144553 RepID=A0A1H6BZC6_9ACTN|nr:DUF6300 family protein [Nonomuraea solani]SEG65486.1 hypothetical protein SAMN05444920_103736 [Nonomuraea solani]
MNRRIEVVTEAAPPDCPRCGGASLLWARVPHGWENATGGRVEGYSGVVLCGSCDADRPHAAALITWFHVHGRADDTDEEFVRLLVAWTAGVVIPALDERALKDEVERWTLGER